MTDPKSFLIVGEVAAVGNTGPISNLKYWVEIEIKFQGKGKRVKFPIPKECIHKFHLDQKVELVIRSVIK